MPTHCVRNSDHLSAFTTTTNATPKIILTVPLREELVDDALGALTLTAPFGVLATFDVVAADALAPNTLTNWAGTKIHVAAVVSSTGTISVTNTAKSLTAVGTGLTGVNVTCQASVGVDGIDVVVTGIAARTIGWFCSLERLVAFSPVP